MDRIQNYINGRLVGPSSRKYLDVFNPAQGKKYAEAPASNARDVEKAVEAASEAFPAWSMMRPADRYAILSKLARLIEKNHHRLASIESKDNGKPLWLAKAVDIPRAASNISFFATAGVQFASESHNMPGSAINYTLRQPIGIVGAISPWNLPLYLFTWKIAPALATGNCVVAKPSEVTPMSAYHFSKLCIEAGLPKGVLNIVHGDGPSVGAVIAAHPKIKAVTFTGSTRVGQEIARVASPMFKKVSLEMGGKNPNIIFADCNYDKMLKTTLRSSFANQGQICLCGSRIYIEKKIYNRFKKDFVALAQKQRVGDPRDEKTKVGAIVSQPHYEKVLSYIKLAKKEGGKILTGGKAVKLKGKNAKGWFIRPTIIESLDEHCRTNLEEIFGPVVTIQPFEGEAEGLRLANTTDYGLSATVWTQDVSKATRMAERLNAGIVWVNTWLLRDLRTPFGGEGSSGVGREGGWEAMRFFTTPKNVCIKY